jgi:GH24 family phage-related lysozyme (muramidase)
MAFALRPVIDTWLKLSTAQGSTLPDNQRQLIQAGTVLPISGFELVSDDHIKVTLGKDAQGNQLQFKGINTWFIYRPAVQILQDGRVIALPTPASPGSAALQLKPLSDTWLKLSTEQGSALPDSQRQFIRAGEVLPLESYAAAASDHLKVTLGKDAQGSPVQFKGRNTWFIYRPVVQILRNGQVISPTPTPPPAPTPAPLPAPAPTPIATSSYVIKTVIDTWLKTSTAQGSMLPDSQRQFLSNGTVLPISGYELVENDHLKVTLGKDAQGNQLQFKGRNTWYIYRPAVQVLNNGKVVSLPVPVPTSDERINARGLQILKSFEGLSLTAYQDSVGVWTIGYGTTSGVTPGMVITEAEAEALLRRDLNRFERAVADLVTVPLNSDQFSALVSFTYNVGEGALADSTLLSLLNQKDYQGAADQFLRWNVAGAQVLPGLTRRRQAERALFLGQDYRVFL